ncbi:MAG: hypothetical protein LBJ02_09125 [Bifidobacteriaceae bacterium]|jgi:hypothetical protein|nr:hypothetical protein [Bifidobacteriaceae bacterium]
MATITLTEFNQNPSRATRLADLGEVIVLRRGVAAYRFERIPERAGDRLEALVQAGLAARPRRAAGPRSGPLPVARAGVDLGGLLEADRGRLDG